MTDYYQEKCELEAALKDLHKSVREKEVNPPIILTQKNTATLDLLYLKCHKNTYRKEHD